jgi:ribosomal protein S7
MPSVFEPDTSWTRQYESDQKREHDYRNLLTEYTMAVARDDSQLVEYLADELVRVYRESRCACGRRKERPRRS